MRWMRGEKEKFTKESKYTNAFSMAIVVAVVLSGLIGILPAKNESFNISAGSPQTVTGTMIDTQKLFIEDAPFKIKIPDQNEERLKAPEKRLIGIPQEGGGEVSFPRVAQRRSGVPQGRVDETFKRFLREKAQNQH